MSQSESAQHRELKRLSLIWAQAHGYRVAAAFKDTLNNGYGNSDDALVALSGTIASVVIGGQIIGTPAPANDHFGFDAQSIGLFKMGGNTVKVGAAPADITLSYITGGDVGIHIAHL
jgi:hypothetical protein